MPLPATQLATYPGDASRRGAGPLFSNSTGLLGPERGLGLAGREIRWTPLKAPRMLPDLGFVFGVHHLCVMMADGCQEL